MASEYFPPTPNNPPSLGRLANTTRLRSGDPLLSPKIMLSLGHLPRKREITVDSSWPKTPSKVLAFVCADVCVLTRWLIGQPRGVTTALRLDIRTTDLAIIAEPTLARVQRLPRVLLCPRNHGPSPSDNPWEGDR